MTNDKGRREGQILEIYLNSTSKQRVLNFVRERVSGKRHNGPFFIVTPNPEILILASNDTKYRKIINSADLSIPDGVGLSQAAKFLALRAPKNIVIRLPLLLVQGAVVGLATFFARNWLFTSIRPLRGREIFLELIKLANKKKWRVFLFGGENGEALATAEKLGKSLKKVRLKTLDGPLLTKLGAPASKEDTRFEKRALATINTFRPHLLFLAFTPPKQEMWFDRNKRKLKARGAMTVGGTFNYIAGKSSLPPRWMENLGLEWFWRLITEPGRLGRVFTAFPIFPLKVFLYKLKSDKMGLDSPEPL